MSSITQKFVDGFDSSNKLHVKWLKEFFEFSKNVAESRGNIDKFLDKNPFGITLKKEDYLEWVHIHFVVSMKYCRDIFDGKALII